MTVSFSKKDLETLSDLVRDRAGRLTEDKLADMMRLHVKLQIMLHHPATGVDPLHGVADDVAGQVTQHEKWQGARFRSPCK